MPVQWIKKGLVTLVAVLTFGLITPAPPAHDLDKQNDQQNLHESETARTSTHEQNAQQSEQSDDSWRSSNEKMQLIKGLSAYVSREALTQGKQKFGTRIGEKLSDPYITEVVPVFINAVKEISMARDKTWIRSLDITHAPAAGYGERIIHVYNTLSGQEVAKLHVRRNHPPQAGYAFQFHYHTVLDGFKDHHEIKTIYWGKNMPPKWRNTPIET
ncbi:YpjP family protein [Sporolactobacillus terrae]|uniref:Cell division protein FtsK n=1 Tax=Sporolactobacillus terrae TaxID=269673 RepID=A0A410D7I4_9BACL|nr:YpjP family protein [Sporolactobacillus terrae]QAA22075.1 hypothetical protein C0674_05280 [Sporolactobacillus terrae]QAA25047.1 hypothetical protein C0679_05255 [Sporolactobacillus terrae]UAK16870.1 YpjP family protein [Sporolactobacillus terrae]BBN98366.1 cell division protein FtsK [Sporolactobacillus terrae]